MVLDAKSEPWTTVHLANCDECLYLASQDAVTGALELLEDMLTVRETFSTGIMFEINALNLV